MSWRNREEDSNSNDILVIRLRQMDDHLRMLERRLDELEMQIRGRRMPFGSWGQQEVYQASEQWHSMTGVDPFGAIDDPKVEKKEDGWD